MTDLHALSKQELAHYIATVAGTERQQLLEAAQAVRLAHYGKEVFSRGLIEFSNHCKNNCYYCGIRRDNRKVERYRLSKEDILECCRIGYELGYRTFVLQSGEDPYFSDDVLEEIVSAIHKGYPQCAITLSLGERSRQSYQRLFDAGAQRYLLRHETADPVHYAKLHPKELTLAARKQCLFDLRDIGYQVGTGFLVGSPFQTPEHLAEDVFFLKELRPSMIGIGPFIPQSDTPFGEYSAGSLEQTVTMLAILRVLFPTALIPATTAVGTLHPKGREKALQAGANVVMPNLSPTAVRSKYLLYDNKICTGDEAAECRVCLGNRVRSAGFEMTESIGNPVDWKGAPND